MRQMRIHSRNMICTIPFDWYFFGIPEGEPRTHVNAVQLWIFDWRDVTYVDSYLLYLNESVEGEDRYVHMLRLTRGDLRPTYLSTCPDDWSLFCARIGFTGAYPQDRRAFAPFRVVPPPYIPTVVCVVEKTNWKEEGF